MWAILGFHAPRLVGEYGQQYLIPEVTSRVSCADPQLDQSARRSSRSEMTHWLKIKNPAAPAVRREAEEDWASKRWGRERRRI